MFVTERIFNKIYNDRLNICENGIRAIDMCVVGEKDEKIDIWLRDINGGHGKHFTFAQLYDILYEAVNKKEI